MNQGLFRRAMLGLVPAFLLFVVGCGGSSSVPVRGTVTLDGEAYGNVNVTFMGDGITGTAKAGPDGTFNAFSSRVPGTGLPEGEYTVVVTQALDPSEEIQDITAYEAVEPPFPRKYSDMTQSPIKVTVRSGETNDFEIKMEK
jgi:hypothetical protein